MKLRLIPTSIVIGLVALLMSFSCCNHQPTTHTEEIESLKKQLVADAQTLQEIEANDFVSIERDFRKCDSMLQYQSQEQVVKSFEKLRLVQAYIEQFKATRPVMQAEIDSTLRRLDLLQSDAETNHFPDSLVTVYIESETAYVTRLNNQVQYFEDRFDACKKDLDTLKKQQ